MAKLSDLDPDQERLLTAIVLAAVNEGEFYADRDVKSAVNEAWKSYRRAAIENLMHDYRMVRSIAERQVRKQWGTKRKGR